MVIPDGEIIDKEPNILLANNQIRKECLPLYYGRKNSFTHIPKLAATRKCGHFAISEAASYLQDIHLCCRYRCGRVLEEVGGGKKLIEMTDERDLVNNL